MTKKQIVGEGWMGLHGRMAEWSIAAVLKTCHPTHPLHKPHHPTPKCGVRMLSIHNAIEEYLGAKQNSVTRKTYQWYAEFLDLFERFCNDQPTPINSVGQVSPSTVQAFVAAVPSNASPHTRHARAQVVKGFLRWCSLDEELGVRSKVVDRIEMPKLVQADVELYTPEDIARLIRACDRLPNPHRNRAIVHLLLDTGMRASECCYDGERAGEETGLRMDNLYLGRGEAYVWIMGKGLKPRTVGLGNETTQAMRRYLNRERPRNEGGWVFLSRRGEALSVRMLEQCLTDLGECAGVPHCHPHRFRHTFAVNQLLAGTSDLVLMRLMGHSSLESTKIYTRAMSGLQARRSAPSVVDRMRGRQKE